MTNQWLKCCQCGEQFMLNPETEATLRRSSQLFHCPWGHSQHFPQGETAADKLRRENQRLTQRLAQKDDEITWQREHREAAERTARAYKGQTTRLRNRAKAGVCPCCNRSFSQLAQHMANKHPDFTSEPPPLAVIVGGKV